MPAQKIRDLELYKLLQLDRFEEDLRISRVRLSLASNALPLRCHPIAASRRRPATNHGPLMSSERFHRQLRRDYSLNDFDAPRFTRQSVPPSPKQGDQTPLFPRNTFTRVPRPMWCVIARFDFEIAFSTKAFTISVHESTAFTMDETFVKLKYASQASWGGGGGAGVSTHIEVKVKNIEYQKDVQLHVQKLYDIQWYDLPLGWKLNCGNYDVFSMQIVGQIDKCVREFVIRCTIGGRTCWDNNNQVNYDFGFGDRVMTGCNNVVLMNAELVFTDISGAICVNGQSYHKRVGIRYSYDDWRTWYDQDAFPAKSENRFRRPPGEIWEFLFGLTPQQAAATRFAVYHQNMETGQCYWDNNFGQNYDFRQVTVLA